MNLLLDTHVLLWWLQNNAKLSNRARKLIESPRSVVHVSTASAWEISIKKNMGKLDAPDNLVEEISSSDFRPLSLTLAHGVLAGQLPLHHADPFDRMLVAQAIIEDLTLVTRDEQIMQYDVTTLLA